MTDAVHQRHNKLFSEYFGRSDVARDFVAHYLPPDIVSHFDLSSLDIRKDSFIDAKLAEHFSDLLYQIDLTNSESAYIYILFDHKSYVDSWVAFQLLRYMMQIWEVSLREQQAARKDQPEGQKEPLRLPPIMPLVVYHGEENWCVSQEFMALFGEELPDSLRAYLPNYHYWLWNLRDTPPEQVVGGVLLRVVALLLKYANSDELESRLPEILSMLRELGDRSSILHNLRIILRYLSGSKQPLDEEELQEVVDQLFAGGDFMPTFIEKQIEQAHQEGRYEGRQEGETIGLLKGQRLTQIKNIKLTLAVRFEVELERYDEFLSELRLPQLEELLRVALKVQEVSEFDAVLDDLVAKNKAASASEETD